MNILLSALISFSAYGFFDTYKSEQLMRQKEYAQAYELNKNNAIAHPENPAWWYNAGFAAFQSNEYKNAREAFFNASLSDDKNIQKTSLFNAGSCSALLKEYPEALDTFEKLLKMDPHDEKVRERYELIKKLMEEQKNQDKEDQSDDKQDKKKDDNQQEKSSEDSSDNQSDQSKNKEEQQSQKSPQSKQNDSSNKSGSDKPDKRDEKSQKKDAAKNEKKDGKEQDLEKDKKDGSADKKQQQKVDTPEQKKDGQERFAQLDAALQSIEEGSHTQMQQYVQEQTASGNTRQW